MFSSFHEISIFQPKWLRFRSKTIFAVTFMIFWNILAHNFLVSHHMDLKFCREIRCNKYLKIKSKNFNISNHFGLFWPKMTENSKTAYRRPLPNWPMESVWNFQIFLCNHLLYTKIWVTVQNFSPIGTVVFILLRFTVSAALRFGRLGRNTQPQRLSW